MPYKKIIIILVVAIFMLAGIYFGWHYYSNTKSAKLPSNVTTSPIPGSNNLNNERKKSSAPATTLNNGPSSQPSNSNTSSTSKASITITRADIINGTLQVGTLVTGATTGSCTLYATQQGQATLSRTNPVKLQTNAYTCAVFDIPTGQFPNQGSWNISVRLTSGSYSTIAEWNNNPINL